MQRQGSLNYFIFRVITLALQKSRRERLKEELDSDIEYTSSKKARNRVILSYTNRALQDFSRVQFLHPLSFSILMIFVFVATTRTASISLLGIVVFQIIFSRGGKAVNHSEYLYELFFKIVFLIVLGNMILGIAFGFSTASSKLGVVSLIIFALILIAFLAHLISSLLVRGRQISKPQIVAKWLHMSIICVFIFDLTVGKNLISQTQLVLLGTVGWLIVLGLGRQRKQDSSTVSRSS